MNQQVAKASPYPEILVRMAADRGVDPALMNRTLCETIFPSGNKPPTPEQITSLLFVADKYGLDPWIKQIYAYPAKGGGITPVMGIDGWLHIANSHPEFDGMTVKYGREDDDHYCEVVVHRKDRANAPAIREWLSECKRSTDPWRNMPKRMLRNRAVAQAVRTSFGVGGVYLEDEAQDFTPKAPRDVEATEVDATKALMGDSNVEVTEHGLNVTPHKERIVVEVNEEARVLTDEEADAEESKATGALFSDAEEGGYTNG